MFVVIEETGEVKELHIGNTDWTEYSLSTADMFVDHDTERDLPIMTQADWDTVTH